MKKLLALILAAAFVLSVSGCGANETANVEDVTITWLVFGEKQADSAAVMEAASKISMEKIGAKIDIQYLDNAAYTERMTMNFASGSDDYDICFTGYVNPYKDAVIRGAYLELDDYIEKSKIKDSIPEYALKNARINGKIYGVPNIQILPGCAGLFINKALADEAKLDVNSIKDLDDIEPFLEWVKNNHPEKYPFRTGRYSGGSKEEKARPKYETVVNSVSIAVNADDTYEVLTDVEKDNLIEEELMYDWYTKGYIRSDVASAGDDTSEYLAGRFAVWRGWYKPGTEAEIKNTSAVNECYAVPITPAYMEASAGVGCMTAINVNTKHPDLAFKMLELMNTDKEFYNIICNGIEGKHYTLTDDGLVRFIENSGYCPNASWKFGNVFNSIPIEGQPADIWEATEKFNDDARKSPILGFSFDPTSVRTEITQVATVKAKYKNLFVKPADEWRDTYYAALKEAGIDNIKAEVIKQLDAWKQSNK